MAINHVRFNGGKDVEGPNIEKWNEVVIDECLMLHEVFYDPVVAIPAIIYDNSLPQNKGFAQQRRDEFCKYNFLEHKIPIVAADRTWTTGSPGGPFMAEDEDDEETLVI